MTNVAARNPRPLAVAAGTLMAFALAAAPLAAQDTTRTRPDTTRARADSTARADSARLGAPIPAQDTAHRVIPPVRVPPPVPPPWRFGLEIGFTDVSGNRDLQVFNGVFTTEHQRTTDYVFNTRFEARYGKSDSRVAVSNSAIRLRFDWRPRTGVSPFLGLDFESDMIRKIDSRISGGTGLNFNIAPREDRRTTIAVGLIAEIEDRFQNVSPNHISDTRFHLRFATIQPLSGTATFEGNAKLQPATRTPDDYLFSADASLRVTITRTLAFRTRYEWKRDSTPAPGVLSKDDRSFTVSLLLSW